MKKILFLLAVILPAAPQVQAADVGDAEKGARVYKKCVACHLIGEGAKHRIGPHLNNIIGRRIAGLADYRYSKAMTEYAAANPRWTPELLTKYLANPRGEIRGTKMSFAGLRRDKDIANLLAYLETASE